MKYVAHYCFFKVAEFQDVQSIWNNAKNQEENI